MAALLARTGIQAVVTPAALAAVGEHPARVARPAAAGAVQELLVAVVPDTALVPAAVAPVDITAAAAVVHHGVAAAAVLHLPMLPMLYPER